MRPPILLDLPESLDTERLLLRPPAPGDGPAINAAILDSWDELHHWMPWARVRPTVDESEQYARQASAAFRTRADIPLLIVLRDTATLIGSTGLHRMDWAIPRFEIGYWIRTGHGGHGYISETVRAVAQLALGTLTAARVEIHCSHRNLRSQRVAERSGFTLEGRLRNHGREPSGDLRDTMIYARTPDDAEVAVRPA